MTNGYSPTSNVTEQRGACTAPFLQLAKFPGEFGYLPGRFCAPVPTLEGTVDCCLPCPITDWVYSDEFNVVPKAANWLNVVGMVCSISLIVSFLILPVKSTNRHYLTVGLIAAVCLMQLGFIIPLAADPEQCHDAITPNDMYSDRTCAFSGAFLLFGGFSAILWGFLRSLSIHLQICWQVVPGNKFFTFAVLAGWGLPALFVSVMLPVTGTSYRFGNTCHINHYKALDDYWGFLLAFAAISTTLQFTTFGYCIKVYIRSLFNDSTSSDSQVGSGALPSYASRSGSTKTVTAAQAYRRVKRVIELQWRGTVIVLIIIVNVVFLSIVFIQMDNTVTAAMQDLSRAESWLLCLATNGGDKNPCLQKVKDAGLVTNEATVMAVLIMLSLNGIWTLLFLGRTSMIIGWANLIRGPFRTKRTDFASVDARRYSNNPKTYEMITSPPSRAGEIPKVPEPVMTKHLSMGDEEGLSPLPQSPPSPSSEYTNDGFSKEMERQTPTFGKDAEYRSPKLSFSTPRPPSAGRTFSRELPNVHRSLSPPTTNRSFSPVKAVLGRSSPSWRDSGGRSLSPEYDWDPASTHAKPFRRQDPSGL